MLNQRDGHTTSSRTYQFDIGLRICEGYSVICKYKNAASACSRVRRESHKSLNTCVCGDGVADSKATGS